MPHKLLLVKKGLLLVLIRRKLFLLIVLMRLCQMALCLILLSLMWSYWRLRYFWEWRKLSKTLPILSSWLSGSMLEILERIKLKHWKFLISLMKEDMDFIDMKGDNQKIAQLESLFLTWTKKSFWKSNSEMCSWSHQHIHS